MHQNLWPDEIKILAIDDHQDILNLIRLSLEPAGFRLIRTSDAKEGLTLAMREQPDLLLLDLMMPDLDGYELLRRLRRHPKLEKLPVIVVSAKVNTSDQMRMMQVSNPEYNSIDAYLGKPFSPAVLLKTVKEVLLKHRDYILEKNTPPEKPWEKHLAY
ncbi:MAG: response regulator [Anaerolineae bacterium]|nr:response regulator [Anaerolineae bacterium]